MSARTVLLNIIANDNVSRTLRGVHNELRDAHLETSKLSKAMNGLNKVGKVAGLATAGAGALALAKAAAPAAGAVAALPAAMATATIASKTLKLGLVGVGDAMSAVADGDAKKLDEALKKLSPNARAFVKQAAGMRKEVVGLQQGVQNRLFAGLDKDLKALGGSTLPVARTGMNAMASALNGIGREAVRVVANPWFSGQLSTVFSGSAKIMETLKSAVQPTLESVILLTNAGMPLAQRMAQWAVHGARTANTFLTSAKGAKALATIVQSSGDRLAQLGRIARNLVSGLLGIVNASGAFNATGGDMLRTVEQLTAKFAVWARSAEGQKQLGETFRMLGQFAREVAAILPLVLGPLGLIAKGLTSLPGPVRGVVTQMLAWAVVIGVVTKNLRLLTAVTVAYRSVVAGSQFIAGFMNVNRAQADGASRATRLGAAFRTATAAIRAWIVAQLQAARAAITSALATARQTVATVATAVAQRAAAVAARIWAAAQWVLNAAMSANPIGLVVLAIVGLVAAFVLAYKKVGWFRTMMNAVFSFLKTAVVATINFVRNHWRLIITVMLGPLGFLIAMVTKYWSQISGAVMAAVRFMVNFVRNHWRLIITIILGPLGFLIAMVTKHWGTIKAVTSAALGWITVRVRAGMNLVRAIFGAVLNAIVAFVAGRWNVLKAITSALASGLLSRIRTAMNWIRSATSAGISAVTGIFTRGWDRLKSLTSSLASSLRSRIDSLMGALRNAFSRGVDAIGRAWDRLRGAAKAPVNFMIGTVYNRGIVGLWNKVMGWLKIGGMNLGTLPLLARGGTLANPAAAGPMMTNGPMAIVGEGRRAYPEFVIPTDPRYRDRAQGLWAAAGGKLQMLAKGGVLGDVLGGIKKAAGKVVGLGKDALDLITNPGKIFDRMAGPVLGMARGIGGGPWGSAIGAIPRKMLDQVKGAALQVIKAFNAGYGGDAHGVVKAAASMIGKGDDGGDNINWITRAWGMPGAPWCAMFVSEAIKQAKATKRYPGYPSAAVASFVGAMKHVGRGEGRPGDLGAYRGTGHINVIERNLGGGMYQTIGGNEGPRVKRSTRGGQSAILRPLARGGLVDIYAQRNFDRRDRRNPIIKAVKQGYLFDDGGMLQPGWTLAHNATGRPEPVFPSLEAAAAYGNDGTTVNQYITVYVQDPADVDMLARRLEFQARAAAF